MTGGGNYPGGARAMSFRLARALDALTPRKRLVVRRVLRELADDTTDGAMAALYAALAHELALVDLRALDDVRQVEEAARAVPEEILAAVPPLPGPDGAASLHFDPDTGEVNYSGAGE